MARVPYLERDDGLSNYSPNPAYSVLEGDRDGNCPHP